MIFYSTIFFMVLPDRPYGTLISYKTLTIDEGKKCPHQKKNPKVLLTSKMGCLVTAKSDL